MLAIIEVGSKQYRVGKDQIVYVDPTGKEPGSEISLDTVLLLKNGTDIRVGAPYVSGARVTARVLEEVKAPKIYGFKYKRRKNYHRAWGHRQRYHKLQILGISA